MSVLQWIYTTSLFVGIIYSAVSLLLHGLTGIIDVHVDADLGGFDIFLPLRPFTIMVFSTVFGGIGLITHIAGLTNIFWIIVPITIGYITAVSLYNLLFIQLRKMEKEVGSDFDIVGNVVEVSETILAYSFGTVKYSMDSNIMTATAKAAGQYADKIFTSGTKVHVKDFKDNVFYIEPYNEEDI